jgi:hypothetical protein
MVEDIQIMRAMEKLLEELSKEFNIPPPTLEFYPLTDIWQICGDIADACFDYERRRIVINSSYIDEDLMHIAVKKLLHEFMHYYQFVRAGYDDEKAFPSEEMKKAYCRRSFEKEAKQFARENFRKYFKRFKVLLKSV